MAVPPFVSSSRNENRERNPEPFLPVKPALSTYASHSWTLAGLIEVVAGPAIPELSK